MKKALLYIFMVIASLAIWCGACAFVDYIVPDIANSYKMLIGAIAGAFMTTVQVIILNRANRCDRGRFYNYSSMHYSK